MKGQKFNEPKNVDKLLCIWQHSEKTPFYKRAITRQKIIQPENPHDMHKALSFRSML
jgi:hypothetical protein